MNSSVATLLFIFIPKCHFASKNGTWLEMHGDAKCQKWHYASPIGDGLTLTFKFIIYTIITCHASFIFINKLLLFPFFLSCLSHV